MKRRSAHRRLFLLLFLLFGAASNAADFDQWTVIRNIEYARAGEHLLKLDLHLPRGKVRSPLIVWVHGGAWYLYDKKQFPKALVENGFALASLDFRQSTEARFPAQVHDIKAGIRFLRAKPHVSVSAPVATFTEDLPV